jgi:polyhydroxyalkanoate synthesis regulator phasin
MENYKECRNMSKKVKDERMQILEMVEDGKINTSEAMELLDALERDSEEITSKKDAKWLKIRVKTLDDSPKVNVNIPISLVEVGLKLAKKFDPKLEESGLDQIDLDEILEAVKNGAEGKIVDVEDEENQTRVKIYVE